MSMLEFFLLAFWDTVMGHVIVLIYLFAVIHERIGKKQMKKLPLLLLSPFLAALLGTGCWILIPDFGIVRYGLTSFAMLLLCTVWVMGIWRFCFWRAFSTVCMAAILQVATSALFQTLFLLFWTDGALQYVVWAGGLLTACAAALFVRRFSFGKYFRLLMEEASPRQTALFMFVLEITMEAFLLFQNGVYDQYLFVYSCLVTVLAVLMTGLVGYLGKWFGARQRIQMQEDMLVRQQLYERELEDIRREMSLFRHDYKNLLASFMQQTGSEDPDKLRESLEELDAGFDHHLGEKIQIFAQIGNLQIPQIRSLLLNKLALMRKKGIACRLEALYPVEQVGMEIWDFVRCIGILIDNAMEAALDTKRPWVEIVLLQQEHTLFIHVSNPYRNRISPDKIWEEGYSTKGRGRGMGLSGYQRILEGCPNAFSSTSWNNGIFVQELTIGGWL